MLSPLILIPSADLLDNHPYLSSQAKELSQAYAEKKVVTDNQLKPIGSALWSALGDGVELQQAKHQAGQSILPIVIESDIPAILQLPWEMLWHPEYGFLALHKEFTLSRSSPAIKVHMPDIETGPLRILLFSSLPDDLDETDQLQIEEEQAGVLEALGPWLQSGHVVIEMPDDGRFSLFEELLHSFRPHLVWLSGHGVFSKDLLNHNHKGYFLFEDEESGNGSLVDENTLAGAFSGTAVQGVILSACQSGKAISSDLNNGLMYALAQKGIPHVIGMRESIFDRAGVQFAKTFFSGLLQKREIAQALQQARQAITMPMRDDEHAKRYRYADLSFGQWCLPMLLSREHNRSIIDWHFMPQPMGAVNRRNRSVKQLSLPERFIGRRRELRKIQQNFRNNQEKVLLLIGAGGMGKTAFAGKLLDTLKSDGYEVFYISIHPNHDWRKTISSRIPFSLDDKRRPVYDNEISDIHDIVDRAECLFVLLLEQFDGKVALLYDNIESVQDPLTCAITDRDLQRLIDLSLSMQEDGLHVLLTSRWALPEWKEPVHPLGKPVYRDFLAVAQQQKLPKSFLRESKRLRKAYDVLNGNYRALEFFSAALQNMDAGEEEVFLQQLQKAEAEIQVDMALEKVWRHRTAEEQELLRRMTAFEVPVALEGVQKIAMLDPQQPVEAMETLLSVSLIERYYNPKWKTDEFLVSSLVRSWLEKQGVAKPEQELLQQAATYHEWLLEYERNTLDQAITTHTALMSAGMDEKAHRITLDWIVGPMNMAGMYQTLLQTWLLPACNSADQQTLAEALGQTGKQYHHVGEYDTALEYLKRSLAICEEIGDKKGEGATLNNISQIYHARGEYDTALEYLNRSLAICQEIGDKKGEGTTLNNISLIYKVRGEYDTALEYLKRSLEIRQEIGDSAGLCATLFNMGHIHAQNEDLPNAVSSWVTSYRIASNINLAEGLQALAALAPQLGLPEGLEGWEMLAKQMDEQQKQS